MHFSKLTIKRSSHGRTMSPEYEVQLDSSGNMIWCGSRYVQKEGRASFVLDHQNMKQISELTREFLSNPHKSRYVRDESNTAFSEIRILLSTGQEVSCYENFGGYVKSADMSVFRGWLKNDLLYGTLTIFDAEDVVRILWFEYQLDQLLGVDKLIGTRP